MQKDVERVDSKDDRQSKRKLRCDKSVVFFVFENKLRIVDSSSLWNVSSISAPIERIFENKLNDIAFVIAVRCVLREFGSLIA